MSVLGGSAWSWNTERKQFYLHQFSDKQPDFNLRNREVHNEFYVSVRMKLCSVTNYRVIYLV